ncbi:ABC1-domain-containing protein [Thozetella sp. PMI_491]|nr:ABC1-domain-containing protein [Thozetella sp. PMI_491]
MSLVRKHAELELMPPPPAPKRIKRPKKVLDEDTYTEALSQIIARDFFPGLLESETQQEYLDALDSKDEEWIASAGRRLQHVMTPGRQRVRRGASLQPGQETPVGVVGDTPVSMVSTIVEQRIDSEAVDTNMSLGAFQSKYTSEDNESFYKLLDKQNLKRAEKYAWLWNGNKMPSKQQLKQKEVEVKLQQQTRSLVDDGFKRDRLAIRDKDDRPAGPDTWKAKPNNQLMFAPDGIEDEMETVAQRDQAESRAPPKAIVYANTRMPQPDISYKASSSEPSLAEVRDAIAGKRRACDSESSAAGGGETPRVNGYAFVDDEEPEPEPAPAPAPASRIDLGPGDATPNPFQFQDQRKREALHHRMVDRIAEKKRTSAKLGLTGKVEKTPVPKFPNSPRVSGGLTPAAQRLWGKIDSAGRKLTDSPFNRARLFSDVLVDLAAVVSASRSVASKHVALRRRQLDRYGKTSSVIASLRQEREGEKPIHRSGDGAATAPTESAAATQIQPTTAAESGTTKGPEPASRSPLPQAHRHPQSTNLNSDSAPGDREFVPAPWAANNAGFIHQTIVANIPREPLPRNHGIPHEKDVQNVPTGINLDIFHTRSASRILKSLREKEAFDSERSNESTASTLGTEQIVDDKQALPATETLNTVSAPEAVSEVVPMTLEAEKPMPEPTSAQRTLSIDSSSSKNVTQEDTSTVLDPTGGEIRATHQLRESRVPSTRLSRMWNYSGLAVGMFAGAIGEGLSRAIGGGGQGSVMLSEANMERLVAKLSRMRGAALKMGQVMSFQDSKMLPAPIQEVLQRVQDRADYMPTWQRDKVLASNLGQEWREIFGEFEEKPIAAASIGQVHRATLKSNGAKVAVKIQFPGVADSINSDLDNLGILLAATSLLPKGLYLNKTIENARTELAWECDYAREAESAERYRELLTDENDVFQVPRIYPEASGKQVLTMEFMEGVGVTRVKSFTQEQRDWIGTQILRLCLREITEFKFMQTDPNWTNFQYNAATNKLELLDFGASREYPDRFIRLYVSLLEAASKSDRATVKVLSEELGYLTGHESKVMLDAHITSVLTLAEPFLQSAPELYDFQDQTITERVKAQIPVMIHERLAPPPEETYSLHRKLSGAFLLCARLGSQVRCRELFEQAVKKAEHLHTKEA